MAVWESAARALSWTLSRQLSCICTLTGWYREVLALYQVKTKSAVDLVPAGVSIGCWRGVPLVPKLQAVAEVGKASLWR